MAATSGSRSEGPKRDPRVRTFERSIERATNDAKVSPVLGGLLRALLVRRRRSGDDRVGHDERDLLYLLPLVFQGDYHAQERAAAIVRRMIGAP